MNYLGRASVIITFLIICQACARDEEIDINSLIARCAECHTEQGQTAFPGWPAVAGMEKTEIIEKLKGHRKGVVSDSTMSKVIFDMTDEEIDAVAEYFSELEPTDASGSGSSEIAT